MRLGELSQKRKMCIGWFSEGKCYYCICSMYFIYPCSGSSSSIHEDVAKISNVSSSSSSPSKSKSKTDISLNDDAELPMPLYLDGSKALQTPHSTLIRKQR